MNHERVEAAFKIILEEVGEDPTREGLLETPKRMAKAWEFWCQGYTQNPREYVKTFADGAEHYDEMVLMKNLSFYSQCEHHLAPFFGRAHIAYIPKPGSVLGISKLGRILDIYARRLQIQERMTNQIADCIQNLIDPAGVAVVVEARHLCTESRGLDKQGHTTITSCMLGVFRENLACRNEFMALIK